MDKTNFDTLSQATNALTKDGYTESFKAENDKIIGTTSKKKYLPEELEITKYYRFDGMTNPQDDTIVFAIKAKDGAKGTLIMSYSSEHNQNIELVKKIPEAEK